MNLIQIPLFNSYHYTLIDLTESTETTESVEATSNKISSELEMMAMRILKVDPLKLNHKRGIRIEQGKYRPRYNGNRLCIVFLSKKSLKIMSCKDANIRYNMYKSLSGFSIESLAKQVYYLYMKSFSKKNRRDDCVDFITKEFFLEE